MRDDDSTKAIPPTPDVLRTLVQNHREFLAFLERRLGDRVLAEEVLQEAFVRTIDRLGTLRDSESARAWFYRTLRNALIDRARRGDAEDRRLEKLADELRATAPQTAELESTVCSCILRLAGNLKPEYAELLRRVDVEGQTLAEFARSKGIAANHAGVRALRARTALRREVIRSCGTCAEHGCFDCSCRAAKR